MHLSTFLVGTAAALLIAGCGGGSSSPAPVLTAAPVFSPAGGSYTSAQSVTISDATSGAVIYYTVDGTTPTTASSVYSSAIPVAATTTVSATAAAPGDSASASVSATYTIAQPPAATPTITPVTGTYSAAQTVSIADTTTGAAIYYTLDGSTPTAASTPYAAPFTVSKTTTVGAVAVASGFSNSAVASSVITIDLPAAATPVISPGTGTYTSVQTVTITDATAGAAIYYTLDGSTPTMSSSAYTGPLTVSTTSTINAIAVAAGYNDSATASAVFTISFPAAPTPTFTPAAGVYTTTQTIAIGDVATGAAIYYTLDGTTPTTASMKYTTPLTVSATTTINAIATAPNYTTSAVGSATFTINLAPAATPAFSPAAGTFSSAQTITLSDATAGAAIYYTTNGSVPTSTTGSLYSAPISVASTETINAIATATGYSQSAVGTAAYTINLPAAATPAFSVAPGTFTSTQTVSIADATPGAAIYYTANGSTPTTASMLYAGPISVSSTETISAIATATGYTQSPVASAQYTINEAPTATPAFSPAPGTYTSTQTVALADSTTGAKIYYTLNGTVPTTASTPYAGPISVSSTETISAIATATGYATSAVATGAYTINLPAAAVPTFSPAPGIYTSQQTVMLADATAGTTIYYTTNGSAPTATSSVYGGPITVSATETINAIATAAGYTQSAVATGAYTINLPAAATPTFSPAAGSYSSAQTVTIADATAGAAIYYTLDGNAPTTASNVYSTPITVSTTETINALATSANYTQSAVGTAAYTITVTSPTVAVSLRPYNVQTPFAAPASVQFGSSPASTNQLLIDETQQFQTIEGFGASFTDASAYDLENVETPSLLAGTLSDLFTTTGNGIGLSFMRNPIGASDMARSIYTFDDVPAGQTDPTLSKFSIAHDEAYIIPLIQAAKKLNPSMKLMVSPWSAPAWMKTTDSIEGGSLNTSAQTYLANYLVKYIQAYASYGLLPDYLSVQNEPLNSNTGYPTELMPETQELPVIRDSMLPALTAANLSTRVLLYDHNWDTPSYPASLLTDATLLASPQVAGTAWHGYEGPPGAQLGVQNQYPTKGQWETEHSGGTFVTNQFIDDFDEITLVMRSAGKSYVKWNLALDQNRGPNTSTLGSGYSGCNTCSGLVTVNSTTGAATETVEYYTLGQFSRFIQQGAVRVWSSDTPDVVSSAYINPDGTRVLVAFNNSFAPTTFQVQWGASQNFSYTLTDYAAVTFVWSGTQTGVPTQTATQQIQGANFTTATGLEVENTSDNTGSYDLGYVVDGATAYYRNVNFGTGVSSVNVRTASGGNGGTAEFHLDSPTGTLLGTASLPPTGGYQTWETINTPVAGTSVTGVHDLYMIIHGSGGIANVNWFQFQ